METSELIEIISRGEDGKNQFKADARNNTQLAAEMVAFCNSGGGRLFLGVNDNGSVSGLQREDVSRLNLLISDAATNLVKPSINPETENVRHPDGIVIVLRIPDGLSKPYMDNSGAIWVKSGSDKRKVTSREEIQRMLQKSGLVHGDEIPANGVSIVSIDMDFFTSFYEKEFGVSLDKSETNLTQLLKNMNLADGDTFNVAGALMFAQAPQFRLPAFIVKAVAFPGNDIEDTKYIDSKDISGRLSDVFQRAIAFLLSNTRSIQGEQGVNSVGSDEIPRIVFEELAANALIHRDYFITAPIRILVFANRIEIISPGHLPNNLTIENIKNGNSNSRNPILASFASKMLPYRGLGSGIKRALKEYKEIDFVDDREGNKFIAIIKRPK